jgi:hypothetical protein
VSSLLSYTLWRTITTPITYLLVTVLVSTALLQIKYLNRALQRFDSTQVIPTQFVLFTLSVIIGSAVLYRDFKQATLDRVLKFIGGCALTFLGVYFITSGRPRGDEGEDGEMSGDEEDAIGLLRRGSYDDHSPTLIRSGQKKDQAHTSASVDGDESFPEVEDEQESQSHRRSSIISASGMFRTPQRPQSPLHRHSNSSQIMPESTDSSAVDVPSVSAGSPKIGPSVIAVGSSESQLLDNPWQSESQSYATSSEELDDSSKAQPQAVTSAPLLPSEVQASTNVPAPDDVRQRTHGAGTVAQSGTQSRSSLSLIIPGPLLPPLSSSLSAVADTLRRGPPTPTRHRRSRLGSLRKARSQHLSPPGQENANNSSHGSEGAAREEPVGPNTEEAHGRPRSLSATFSDIFRGRGTSRSSRITVADGNWPPGPVEQS